VGVTLSGEGTREAPAQTELRLLRRGLPAWPDLLVVLVALRDLCAMLFFFRLILAQLRNLPQETDHYPLNDELCRRNKIRIEWVLRL
jgi:hypothetical protein